ncbi:TPA: hypothetical protein TVN94_001997 [Streptococcus equi subsp. zooepidemicus]|nr:hypothetical protein [Streptococcus equi subsp. zooepidemicus]
MTKKLTKTITLILLAVLTLSNTLPSIVYADENTNTGVFDVALTENNYLTEPSYEDVEFFNDGTLILEEKDFNILNAIENIPDEIVASGSEKINQYFYEKGITQIKVSDKVRQKRGVIGCISAVGLALIVNLTPAKIAKAKSALKALGGAANFVRKTINLYNKFKATKAKITAAKAAVTAAAANINGREILLELFSLGSVYSECFE